MLQKYQLQATYCGNRVRRMKSLLGAFTKLRKATASFVSLSVCSIRPTVLMGEGEGTSLAVDGFSCYVMLEICHTRSRENTSLD
jgi:hypothetical protein